MFRDQAQAGLGVKKLLAVNLREFYNLTSLDSRYHSTFIRATQAFEVRQVLV